MKRLFDWIERLLAAAWQRGLQSAEVDTASLVITRVAFGMFILFVSTPYFGWISDAPQGLFEPPILSISSLIDDFPSATAFLVWDIAVPLLAVCIILGIKTRAACLLMVGGNLLASGFAYSFGKIDHDVLYKIAPACLAFTNWGTRYAVMPDRNLSKLSQDSATLVLAILIAFGFFTAGLEKAYVWIDFNTGTSGFLSWIYSGYFTLGRQSLLAPLVLKVPPEWFELADYSAVAFEVSGLVFLLLGIRYWQAWLLVACLFHLLNTLLLNIPFVEHGVIYAVFLIPPVLKIKGIRTSIEYFRVRRVLLPIALIPVIIAICHITQRIRSGGSEYFLIEDIGWSRQVNLYFSMIFWLFIFMIATFAWWREKFKYDTSPR